MTFQSPILGKKAEDFCSPGEGGGSEGGGGDGEGIEGEGGVGEDGGGEGGFFFEFRLGPVQTHQRPAQAEIWRQREM